MNRLVKELSCIALVAATCAVVIPRVIFPPLASAQRVPVAPPPAAPDTAVISFGATPPPATSAPPPEAPVDDTPVAPRSHGTGRAQGPDSRSLPRGVTWANGHWIADLRALSPVRNALAGTTLVPPGEGPHREGYLVTSTDRMGLLRAAGVRPGDVLIGVNGMPLRNPDDALDAISRLRGATRATFEFQRGGSRFSVPVELTGRAPGAGLTL